MEGAVRTLTAGVACGRSLFRRNIMRSLSAKPTGYLIHPVDASHVVRALHAARCTGGCFTEALTRPSRSQAGHTPGLGSPLPRLHQDSAHLLPRLSQPGRMHISTTDRGRGRFDTGAVHGWVVRHSTTVPLTLFSGVGSRAKPAWCIALPAIGSFRDPGVVITRPSATIRAVEEACRDLKRRRRLAAGPHAGAHTQLHGCTRAHTL